MLDGTYGEIVKEMVRKIDFDLNDLQVVIGPATSNSMKSMMISKVNLKH